MIINSELVLAAQKSVDGKQYKLVNNRHVPYINSIDYLTTITSTRRHVGEIGYVVNGSIIETWQFIGGIADINFVKVFPQPVSGGTTTRFGIEDNVGIQDRIMNLNTSFLDITSGTTNFSGQVSDLYIEPSSLIIFHQDVTTKKQSSIDVRDAASGLSYTDTTDPLNIIENKLFARKEDIQVISTLNANISASLSINPTTVQLKTNELFSRLFISNNESILSCGTTGNFSTWLEIKPTTARLIKYIGVGGAIAKNIVTSVNNTLADDAGNITIASTGGDFIPLAGTVVGSPVTGDIIFNDGVILKSENPGFYFQNIRFGSSNGLQLDNVNTTDKTIGFVKIHPSKVQIRATADYSVANAYSEGNMNPDGFELKSGDPTAKGLYSNQDFTANYDSLTYVQKKYVDRITVNGQVQNAAGNITIAIGGGGTVVTANNGLTKTVDNIQLGGALLANTQLTQDFNLAVTDGSLSIGNVLSTSGAKLHVERVTPGIAIYSTKTNFPTAENSITILGNRMVPGGTFTGNSLILGVYGEIGFNSGAFNFTGNYFTSMAGINGVCTMYTGSGSLNSGASMFTGGTYNLNVSGANNIDDFACLRALNPIQVPGANTFTGVLTNHYGLFIDQTSNVTFNITNRYGIYQQGITDVNVFKGPIQADGLANTTGSYLSVVRNIATGRLELASITGGGTSTRFGIEDSTGVQNRFIDLATFNLIINSGSDAIGAANSNFSITPGTGISLLHTATNSVITEVIVNSGSSILRAGNSGAGQTSQVVVSPSGITASLASGISRNLPLSVNGNFADAAGNITVATGGGTTPSLQAVTTVGNTTTLDIEITDATKGIILNSPAGGRWRVTVNNSGVLTTTAI